MKVKLFLDEDIRPLLAKILRERGYDAVSVVERRVFGISDEKLLKLALSEERALVTFNARHFVMLHHEYWKEHWGIILSAQLPLNRLLSKLLRLLATKHKEEVKGQLIWLK